MIATSYLHGSTPLNVQGCHEPIGKIDKQSIHALVIQTVLGKKKKLENSAIDVSLENFMLDQLRILQLIFSSNFQPFFFLKN